MRSLDHNPERNELPNGIKEDSLISAIEQSGYPLQGIVAAHLKTQFLVAEEWGYIDDDTKEHRTLDVYAYKGLADAGEQDVGASTALLIECKRSRHPYVFFQSVTKETAPQFPPVWGVPGKTVTIVEQGGGRQQRLPPGLVLGLGREEFALTPPIVSAFSKGIPKGKKVRLSGSDPFNKLILPLLKALKFDQSRAFEGKREGPIFPRLTIPIAVLDAPMILVEEPEKATDPLLVPWVRVIRQEAVPEDRWRPFRFYAVDIVHVDYFTGGFMEHFWGLAATFADRAKAQGRVLMKGGTVESLDEWEWHGVQPRAET